jgi:hypothetical protein
MEVRQRCDYADCDVVFSTADEYIKHAKLHDGSKVALVRCPYVSCEKIYVWTYTIWKHVREEHEGLPARVLSQDQEFTFNCPLASCYFATFSTVKDVRGHLLSHTDRREFVACPFKDCSRSYRFRSSLSSHFSRMHKNATSLDFKETEGKVVSCHELPSADGVDSPNDADTASPIAVSPLQEQSHNPTFPAVVSETQFSNALADFYNVLMHVHKVPYSTLDYIVKKVISFQVRYMCT